jgi:hypothetical protein
MQDEAERPHFPTSNTVFGSDHVFFVYQLEIGKVLSHFFPFIYGNWRFTCQNESVFPSIRSISLVMGPRPGIWALQSAKMKMDLSHLVEINQHLTLFPLPIVLVHVNTAFCICVLHVKIILCFGLSAIAVHSLLGWQLFLYCQCLHLAYSVMGFLHWSIIPYLRLWLKY